MSRSLLVRLSLVVPLTLASCSEDATDAVGPDGRFLTASGSSVYHVLHAGDVDTDPNPARGLDGATGKNAERVSMGRSHPLGREALVLRKAFADRLDPDGACFPRDAEGDFVKPWVEGESNGYAAWIEGERRDSSRVQAYYYFDAFGSDGASSFNYSLTIRGSVTSGSFAPDPGASATIVWDATASMATEGKGKGKGGVACIGEVPISGGVTITGIE